MKSQLALPALIFIGVALSLPLAAQYILAASLLMVMGLPHGAFDIALEHDARRAAHLPAVSTHEMIALYLAIAGAMAALWLISAAAALILFFLLAFEHFSEELRPGLDPWIARAAATAMLTAPVLLHRPELETLFGMIIGGGTDSGLGAIFLMIAPMAAAIAVSGAAMLIAQRRYREAAKIVVVVAMMLVLPPVIAFTAYFCFEHAPLYLRQVDARLHLFSSRRVMMQAGLFTLIPLTATGALALAAPHLVFSEASIRAAFIMLSVLTLPHMIMPQVLARISGGGKLGLRGPLTPPAARQL
ncbi:Brp/Blh family beta-carotene 15,15'-dioxygenase [Novosphingobium sp. Chol11]|uniref:Brp/Blh family beta-carotene 15,15'-dioxygenase n=1 Tax=Novosphingobium sp. Chol11 TaxID=1385763 RepID=UPI0025D51B16|nr:Brp/Blh family beta-carotene 15,15'-dioxygenase [Novosphingobium sp. Chol11]